MTGLLSSCTLVGQSSASTSHHSRVRQSGGSRVQTITFAAQIKPSHLVVEHSDMCCISTELFLTKKFLSNVSEPVCLYASKRSKLYRLKTELPPGTRLEGVHFLLCYHQFFHFFSRTFTLVWLFWLWNQVGCVFTVAPTFTSGSHWSQIWSRTSAGRTICASFFFFFGNLTLHLQHDAKTAPFWDGRSFHSIIKKKN